LGREDSKQLTGDDKTSLVMSVRDEGGILARMLRPFASHGIDLIKIESRPLRERPGGYYFFLDLKGHGREARWARTREAGGGRSAGGGGGGPGGGAVEGSGVVPGCPRPGALMGVDVRPLVPEWIRTLTPYPPGKPIEEVERELGIQGSVKLASNENPLGPS